MTSDKRTNKFLIIADWVSVSIIAITLFPLLSIAVNGSFAVNTLLLIGTTITHLVCKNIKLLTYKIDKDIFKRPIGASNCNIMCHNGNVSGKPGFPSGHVAQATFFFTFLSLALFYKTGKKLNNSFIFVSISYIGLTCFARLYKKCHTPMQVLAGFITGIIIAFMLYTIWFQITK